MTKKSYKMNLVRLLSESNHSIPDIADATGISENMVYLYLHPDAYERKKKYVREYMRKRREARRSKWIPEESSWNTEDG